MRRRTSSIAGVWLLQTAIIILAPRAASSQELCTLCVDGSPIPNPDQKFEEGGAFEDCAALGNIANILPVGSAICESVQKLGTLCGCPFPETACTLCYDGSRITNKTKETEVLVSDYLIGASSDDEKMDCQTLEAVMHHEDLGSRTCVGNQKNASQQCGCSPPPDDLMFNETSVADNTTTRPPVEMCTICIDGGDITDPDRPIDFGDESPLHDCRGLAESAVFFEVGSTSCTGIRNIGTYCGCSYQRNECTLCPNGEPVPYPYRQVPGFPSFSHIEELGEVDVGSFLTCGVYEAFMQNIDGPTIGANSEQLCLSAHARSQSCGCSPGWKQVLLVWCYRVSGILSLIGSVSILFDILRSGNNSKKLHNTYHQFLLGVSMFDGISSIMYILAAVMLPEETGYYGAFGNDATCKVQGFVLQWGLTSVFYNAMLSIYFFLVICYNFREEKLKRILPYCHTAVNLVGIGLAIGGTWFYGEQRSVCYVTVPLVAKNWLPIIFFNTVPVALALLTMTISTVMICRKVYMVDRKSQRWSMNSSQSRNHKTSKLVFWQSLWYALSFLLTLPFLAISYYLQFQHDASYSFAVAAAILSPAQGFLNALIYYKRKSGLLACCGCDNTHDEVDTSSTRRRRSSSAANFEGNVDISEPRPQSIGRRLSRRLSFTTAEIPDEYAGVRECWELTRGEAATPFKFPSFRIKNAAGATDQAAAATNAAAEVTNSTDSVPFRTREGEDQISIPSVVEEIEP